MILLRKYQDGNELVECRHCNRQEEIASSGYSVRPLRAVAQTQVTTDLMTEILTGLPATM
jgi:hypothetical protein